MTIQRLDSTHPDFQNLVKHLDATLAEHNGENDDFFSQFNTVDTLKNCIVVYVDGIPAACGAFKPFSKDTVEIKRMYTDLNFRKRGLASAMVTELESWAKEQGFGKAVLETSSGLHSAISVYEKSGFYRIPNYGQYMGIESSVCYEKIL
ncbi:GNAT family N-acetyltransferase [Chryseobacterium indologenes]|uniref:GNAT family N-acetyltransferase n=1 Tax=Chryseobacterium TaxID=59732 RepID=UPI0004886DA4|nr:MULTISPECIES: GNAT family N-acetyltransferase [Chryseobacterium]AYZ37202.1 GNAT family N-acetyltransferase [Chryseobacterium indologenes]MBF6646059.1 GNAT family N-acetyltransferase [Chryseobacterium indologenes]MBU3047806.1 GNAT family N-acetyltransferase [Chryseobacterium indologenes]MEB4761106.1 GNAT family N-acetyltransferase [Chryseobacterium indologenes]QQQ70265.1 GNAT family N-acetyltransferase [Chryseobacterium indologenes]